MTTNSHHLEKKMPVLFFGHGSPSNAIENNSFTKKLKDLGTILPKPKAILMISAHWETSGTQITGMENPKTIHDFYGFAQELYQIQYTAKGSPELAKEISSQILNPKINIDDNQWGLDHGTWSILRHLFPNADVPVLQLSLDKTKPMQYHYELGQKISFLRKQGIMIMGSGNIVHNLSRIGWGDHAEPYDWAIEFDEWTKTMLENRNFIALISEAQKSNIGRLSVPTLEHYLPMLYVLGATDTFDQLKFNYEGIQNSSISMRSFSFED